LSSRTGSLADNTRTTTARTLPSGSSAVPKRSWRTPTNKDRNSVVDGEKGNGAGSRGKRPRNNDRSTPFTNRKKAHVGKRHEQDEEV
jgi:hypothetical protein